MTAVQKFRPEVNRSLVQIPDHDCRDIVLMEVRPRFRPAKHIFGKLAIGELHPAQTLGVVVR
jgi:hypothetical protein